MSCFQSLYHNNDHLDYITGLSKRCLYLQAKNKKVGM